MQLAHAPCYNNEGRLLVRCAQRKALSRHCSRCKPQANYPTTLGGRKPETHPERAVLHIAIPARSHARDAASDQHGRRKQRQQSARHVANWCCRQRSEAGLSGLLAQFVFVRGIRRVCRIVTSGATGGVLTRGAVGMVSLGLSESIGHTPRHGRGQGPRDADGEGQCAQAARHYSR